jgi:hypothetical protein
MLRIHAAAIALVLFAPFDSSASIIQLVITGTGSGTVDGTPFTDEPFAITNVCDTLNRVQFFDSRPSNTGYFIVNTTATIDIHDVGTFQFKDFTRTFVSNTTSTVGFTILPALRDLCDGPSNGLFSTWDMLDPIGPIDGVATIGQWTDQWFPVSMTDGRVITFNDGSSPATFQASIVPEPASWTILALGLLAVFIARSRSSPSPKAGVAGCWPTSAG